MNKLLTLRLTEVSRTISEGKMFGLGRAEGDSALDALVDAIDDLTEAELDELVRLSATEIESAKADIKKKSRSKKIAVPIDDRTPVVFSRGPKKKFSLSREVFKACYRVRRDADESGVVLSTTTIKKLSAEARKTSMSSDQVKWKVFGRNLWRHSAEASPENLARFNSMMIPHKEKRFDQ